MKFLYSLIVCSSVMASAPLSASVLNDKVDAIMNEVIEPGAPGCNVGIIHQGQFIHKAGYGMSNLELDVPLNGTQVHRMGSVSKQFAAMAVQLLASEGKINLDADIHTYLPELREYESKVTVRAMLGHVAGMGDYDLITAPTGEEPNEKSVNLTSVAGGPFRLGNEDYLTIDEFYDVVKTVPLEHEPETKFQYSNLAYFLLSMLVEEVSGQTLREYSEQAIFKPLGMRNTFFSDDPVEIVKNRAYGYTRNDAGDYVTDMTNLFWVGDGGLHTNLDDMLIWNNHFYQPKLTAQPAQFITTFNTPNSTFEAAPKVFYANGQFVGTQSNNLKVFSHSGGWLGTYTYFARYPTLDLALAWMCNDVSNDKLNNALNKVRDVAIKTVQ
ncbi:serine hydrolase domain-containing protein [Alteromonas gilva]|uniref:Serine hydrolase n=1 Tax=Alteromonas gilva TaxID=2987522 RepID=A0ABT5L553_9ALTE|nr:serine hydrolase domain-containing protein [Alteromonas gilva]MDC8831516.1 serine hydrolase [Alteromonas gilva]